MNVCGWVAVTEDVQEFKHHQVHQSSTHLRTFCAASRQRQIKTLSISGYNLYYLTLPLDRVELCSFMLATIMRAQASKKFTD